MNAVYTGVFKERAAHPQTVGISKLAAPGAQHRNYGDRSEASNSQTPFLI